MYNVIKVANNNEKYLKLIAAIVIDGVGMLSYFIPILGEGFDMVWSLISGVLIFALFPKHWMMALGGIAEEMFPGTDIIPTATITWVLAYRKNNE